MDDPTGQPDPAAPPPGLSADRNVERAVFETDRHRVVGDLTLPSTGYQSRFSDSLNRAEIEFVALTNVEVTRLDDGTVTQLPFLALSKHHVRLAFPLEG